MCYYLIFLSIVPCKFDTYITIIINKILWIRYDNIFIIILPVTKLFICEFKLSQQCLFIKRDGLLEIVGEVTLVTIFKILVSSVKVFRLIFWWKKIGFHKWFLALKTIMGITQKKKIDRFLSSNTNRLKECEAICLAEWAMTHIAS